MTRRCRSPSASPSCSTCRSRTFSSRRRGAARKPSDPISTSKRRIIMRIFAAHPCRLRRGPPRTGRLRRQRRANAAEQRLPHISIVERAREPAVVLIPGLASPRAVWDGVAPSLRASPPADPGPGQRLWRRRSRRQSRARRARRASSPTCTPISRHSKSRRGCASSAIRWAGSSRSMLAQAHPDRRRPR